MAGVFIDSSALAKLYHTEPGTKVFERLLALVSGKVLCEV